MNRHDLLFTASLWLSASGCALARKHPKAAAIALLTAGFGGYGVAWERATGSDLRNLRSFKPSRLVLLGVLLHTPQVIAGWRLATRPGR